MGKQDSDIILGFANQEHLMRVNMKNPKLAYVTMA